jgi:hypothetical protein
MSKAKGKLSHTKRQHYVPERYLVHFGRRLPGRREHPYRICVYDKPTRRTHESSPNAVANEVGFYDFRDLAGRGRHFERYITDAENEFAPALDELVAHPTIETLHAQKERMARFVALQAVRTPEFRAEMREVAEMAFRLDPVVAEGGPVTEDEVREIQARFILAGDEVAGIFLRLRWALLQTGPDQQVWTSDQPLVWENLRTPRVGMANPGIRLYMPLDPHLALVMVDPAEVVEQLDPRVLNQLQVVWSHRLVFARRCAFDLADQLLEQFPRYADPHRLRFELQLDRSEAPDEPPSALGEG